MLCFPAWWLTQGFHTDQCHHCPGELSTTSDRGWRSDVSVGGFVTRSHWDHETEAFLKGTFMNIHEHPTTVFFLRYPNLYFGPEFDLEWFENCRSSFSFWTANTIHVEEESEAVKSAVNLAGGWWGQKLTNLVANQLVKQITGCASR